VVFLHASSLSEGFQWEHKEHRDKLQQPQPTFNRLNLRAVNPSINQKCIKVSMLKGWCGGHRRSEHKKAPTEWGPLLLLEHWPMIDDWFWVSIVEAARDVCSWELDFLQQELVTFFHVEMIGLVRSTAFVTTVLFVPINPPEVGEVSDSSTMKPDAFNSGGSREWRIEIPNTTAFQESLWASWLTPPMSTG